MKMISSHSSHPRKMGKKHAKCQITCPQSSQFSGPGSMQRHVLFGCNSCFGANPIFSFRPLKQPKAQAPLQSSITLSSRRFSMQGSVYSRRFFKVLFCLPRLSCSSTELAQCMQRGTNIRMISVSIQCTLYSQRVLQVLFCLL